MADRDVVQRIIAALEEESGEKGLDIVSVEIGGAIKAPLLRVRLDNLEGETITLDQVEAAAPWVNDVVDALDPFPGQFMLEVSSPGIDRPLRRLSDFERFAGEEVVVRTNAFEGRKKWTGTIVRVEDEDIILDVDGTEERIPFSLLKDAQIKGKYDFKSRKDA